MEKPTLFIKNMVCNRCIMVVESALKELEIQPYSVELGKVVLSKKLTPSEIQLVEKQLSKFDFTLITNRKDRLATDIKRLIIELVHVKNNQLDVKLSSYLNSYLNYDYNYLSNLFSEVENNTIEQFYIQQKVEKIKELLAYGEFTLSQIAYHLNYSSVAHLSTQFKKITGLTPSQFKLSNLNHRKSIDKL